jgi:succinate-semialdehyde dehydrogenase/glutarate-semialdehyde dehydrogenase
MEPLIRDPRLRKLSFTGSTEVGRTLVEQCASQLLRTSMELGGNAPFLVFEDADVDAAVEGAIVAKMRNGGEACTAANRFLVHESLAGEFTRRLASRIRSLVVRPGLEPGADVGPLVDGVQRDKVEELVDDARPRRAVILAGGEPLSRPGYFFAPTVLSDVPPDSRLLDEEIFGPVAPVMTFSEERTAVAAANATEYGLVAYVYTRDLDCALRVTGGYRRAWSASTKAWSPTPQPRSAGSRPRASAERVALKVSMSTSRQSSSGGPRCLT